MELIRIIKDIEDAILNKVGYIDEFDLIKDEIARLPKLRENIQDYIGYVILTNMSVDFSVGDKVEFVLGVSGVSSHDNDDYLQVVSKCLYGIKKTLMELTYVKAEDINDTQITIDSEEREDSVITYCYTSLTIDLKLAYGS